MITVLMMLTIIRILINRNDNDDDNRIIIQLNEGK